MRKFLFALAGVLALLTVPAAGRAARVEADPNREYVISADAGAYVICVKTYMGPDARLLANKLVLHLRQNGWPAYVFDYSAEEERKAKEWLDARYAKIPPDQRPHRTIRVQKQCGVLIGGYRDFNDASSDVPKVKKTPEPLQDKNVLDVDVVDHQTGRLYQLNTYAQCIAARNPEVTAQKADPNAPDPAWKDLNGGRPYNLLECDKSWTLVVKQFQGPVTIQSRSAPSQFLDMLGFGSKTGDLLEASARQAEEVARVLRAEPFQYQAFVLHTRSGSIVTVGGYDTMDDARLLRTAKELRNLRFGKNTDAIKLFEQPMPMKVPRL